MDINQLKKGDMVKVSYTQSSVKHNTRLRYIIEVEEVWGNFVRAKNGNLYHRDTVVEDVPMEKQETPNPYAQPEEARVEARYFSDRDFFIVIPDESRAAFLDYLLGDPSSPKMGIAIYKLSNEIGPAYLSIMDTKRVERDGPVLVDLGTSIRNFIQMKLNRERFYSYLGNHSEVIKRDKWLAFNSSWPSIREILVEVIRDWEKEFLKRRE